MSIPFLSFLSDRKLAKNLEQGSLGEAKCEEMAEDDSSSLQTCNS